MIIFASDLLQIVSEGGSVAFTTSGKGELESITQRDLICSLCTLQNCNGESTKWAHDEQ